MGQGAIEWIEIPAHDMDALPDFYGSVFGWKIIRDEGFPGYVMFQDTAGNVGGGFYTQIKPAPSGGPLVYITVDDVDRALESVERAGGEVLAKRTLIDEDVGWWGSFRDPAGNEFRVYQRVGAAE